jgi:hypothetical protein
VSVGAQEEYEYIEINDQAIVFQADGGLVRCIKASRAVGSKLFMQKNFSYNDGGLVEDVELITIDTPSTWGDMLRHSGNSGTVRRVKFYPVSGDCVKSAGLYMYDSFCDMRVNLAKGGDPHADGVQTEGGCGSHWYIHNTILCDSDTQTGFGASNAALFFSPRWSFSPCPQIESLVVANNFLSGGLYTSRWHDDDDGDIKNSRYVDNVWETDEYYYNYCAHDFEVVYPDACFEYDNNRTDLGVPMEIAQPACKTTNMVGRDGCGSGIVATPVTTISGFSGGSCSKASANCDDITLSASATTNQSGGSLRWRYSCGGSSTNILSPDPSTKSYQDGGADLWYAHAACNGQTSCTMTDVCDFQSENAGDYTMKVYAETGPGADFRPSDHAEATFTVNP